jgi:uncharacterized oxidoreductase
MNIKNNTILITGGATGIGGALAEAFVKAGNRVIICGRRDAKLKEAKARISALETRVCDVSRENDRADLFNWAKDAFPDLNILVNNAGIQRMIDMKAGPGVRFTGEDEIATNLYAPVRLCEYFTPLLLKQKGAAIVNVSSGLGIVSPCACGASSRTRR